MSNKIKINLKVNGENVTYEVEPQENLLRALRNNFNWDVKCGCEAGECGTCSVLLDGKEVKSCLTLAAACDGHEIWTDKGLGLNDRLTARLQEAFVECGSVQCGFCTPGMILAAQALLDKNPHPTEAEIRRAISGNLCRCTGYQAIVDAILTVSQRK